MQQLNQDGVYVARWGAYTVRLELTRGVGRAVVRRVDDGGPPLATMDELPRRSAAESITWAAAAIERAGGGQVFIDGRSRSLADFLTFEKVASG